MLDLLHCPVHSIVLAAQDLFGKTRAGLLGPLLLAQITLVATCGWLLNNGQCYAEQDGFTEDAWQE